MIRFLIFLLLILASCMVLLGATGSDVKSELQQEAQTVTSDASNMLATGKISVPATASVHLNWSHLNMVYVSKILVLAIIVLMAVVNYMSFLRKKEEY